MLLTSFDPFAAEFDQLTRWAFGPAGAARLRTRALLPMDATRRDDDILLRFDLPGFGAESIDVTVDRGVLTVTARRSEQRAEGDKPVITERVTGTQSRRVALADSLDTDKVEAAYADGVLTVRVPVKETAKPRKVEVRSEAKAELTA